MDIRPVPEDNTPPLLQAEDLIPDLYSPGQWTFDTWPLRRPNGRLARVGGYYVLFSLAVPEESVQDPEDRYENARIRYYFSRDGNSWTDGGELFPRDQALGAAQWAGSAVLENGRVTVFYTAVQEASETPDDDEALDDILPAIPIQRLAMTSARLIVGAQGPRFGIWARHRIILAPDGRIYQTQQQASDDLSELIGDLPDDLSSDLSDLLQPPGLPESRRYAFRDPFFFRDPRTGLRFLVFSSDLAQDFSSSNDCDDQERYNAAVGLAVNTSRDMRRWALLPPLLKAPCVASHFDQPHMIFRNRRYYLFTSVMSDAFAPEIDGWTAMYGFRSRRLFGRYRPLNTSGLVLANPESAPLQCYGWSTLPDFSVLGYALYPEVEAERVDELSPAERFEAFAGTLCAAARCEPTPPAPPSPGGRPPDNQPGVIVDEVCPPATIPDNASCTTIGGPSSGG